MSVFEVFGQAVIGWIIADLISGLLHWFEDRVPASSDTWFGRNFIQPNRLHHDEPLAFLSSSLIHRNSTTWLVVSLIALLWWFLFGFSFVLLAAFVGGMVVSEVHGYAHAPRSAPLWVTVLQKTGLLQSPRHHSRHHAPPQNRHYCILTDLLNPVLDELRVWDRLENGLMRLGFRIDARSVK